MVKMFVGWLATKLLIDTGLHRLMIRRSDPLPDFPDQGAGVVILTTSYTTRRDGLVAATWQNLLAGINLQRRYPRALIVFSPCEYQFKGAAAVELHWRWEFLARQGCTFFMSFGKMRSTITEHRVINAGLKKKRIRFHTVVITTGGHHGYRAELSGKGEFLGKRVYIVTTSWQFETQPDHPVPDQRDPGLWFVLNQVGLAVMLILGLDFAANVQHKADDPSSG